MSNRAGQTIGAQRTVALPSTALRKCFATVALSGTLPDKLAAAAAMRLDGVEIMEADLLRFDASPADVRGICEALGLAVDLYQPLGDFEAMPEPQRAGNMDRAKRSFDFMQALGTDLVLVCGNTNSGATDDDARAAAKLAGLTQRAARRGLRVGYEGSSWGRHTRLWDHACRIVQRAAHPALGLIVDSFHTLSLCDDPSGIAEIPAEKLYFVRMADASKLSMDVPSWSRHFRNFPGQVDLDVPGFRRAAHRSGYSVPLSLEVFSNNFRAAPARLAGNNGLHSLILTEAKESGGPALPDAPVLDRFEFLEDEAAGRELACFLPALTYRQSSVNRILNAEQDSAAGEHFHLHGTSVCAMAIRLASPDRALERAGALLCPEWQERIDEDERQIPALRSPDSRLAYVVPLESNGRSFWEDDFDLLPADREPANLSEIDHVVLTLPAGRMAFSTTDLERSAVLFEARHASLLTMPDNYRDDLLARPGLDDAMLTALQRHELLYDRDEAAEFRHLYSDPFHDRFFLEAVQRGGGCAGFGAANAPVRAADQARQHPAELNLL